MPPSDPAAARALRRLDPLHIVDVFVYVVVLNLAAQFVPSIIAESFAVSLLTALMLKLVLEVILRVKAWVLGRIRSASAWPRRVVSFGMLVLLVPGSKILILELESLLFGDSVSLGGFWAVTGLVVVLVLARRGVRWLLSGRVAD